jgi:hypothetical protein
MYKNKIDPQLLVTLLPFLMHKSTRRCFVLNHRIKRGPVPTPIHHRFKHSTILLKKCTRSIKLSLEREELGFTPEPERTRKVTYNFSAIKNQLWNINFRVTGSDGQETHNFVSIHDRLKTMCNRDDCNVSTDFVS